jgi:hypothetical protein
MFRDPLVPQKIGEIKTFKDLLQDQGTPAAN